MWYLSVLALVATASAQIPSLGWCPDFQPMTNFTMNRFLGTWYEAERYFSVGEIGTRCVATNFEATPEGRIVVSNEITSSLTGLKRVMEGHLQMNGREGEGRILIKYSSLPLPYDSEFVILSTDYDNYAVMWACSGIGPVHTQNIWLMTRERIANFDTMQKAYAVLDMFKISRTFFVKTSQADCTILPKPAAAPGVKSAVEQDEEELTSEKKVEMPIEVSVEEDVPQERSAVPEPAEEVKPMQVPELIMSEKKDMKMEEPAKPEMAKSPEEKKEPEPSQ
ncbi:apolipoprotein D [Manduca sexta]|uniref:Lipocalin/cytosolic fatty-acid binding domain-containing protein n=1 Tax=Manduca sexta TaxID=7130 RepID=A0A922CSJ7_MANSE|nr:apolipoprotein D [Manduca sexta]KAG6456754.1 hypothetical protein O3G_MSEX009930 [Manduca sexta]KAG6456755.1 hypothetical protein O3G_MSEX009930 [Manduca sexta]